VAAVAAARDTIPKDSATLARTDSIARSRRLDSLAVVERAAREARRLAAQRGGRMPTRVDSTPPPKPSRPTPANEVLVILDAPIPSEARIMIEAADLVSLNGIVGTARRPYLTPKRDTAPTRPARDTTPRPAPDTTARPPAAR
jgi:hypothetical protein